MAQEIQKNLVFLANNLSDLTKVLAYLTQKDIISENDREVVKAEKIPFDRNDKLLQIIQTKDWKSIRNVFLNILRKTHNKSCADMIEGLPSSPLRHQKISNGKCWWPEQKALIKSLHRRNYGNGNISLVEELHDRISNTENETRIVICESVTASKYSGMGGMGKTLTAKWYANEYEDEYDHILWIDCGEGSLQKSFESLARDLELKHLDRLDLKEMATKSFDELTDFKCLWIYDNAENYKGDGGIINVLPKKENNFYCIITSRSREWGSKNVGFGKISALELDIFSDEETLTFLKSTLDDSIEHTNSQLKELGRLMGNLPLALQLAVAALNDGKIDLQNYIDKTSSEDLGNIVDEEFDDYEKTINKNIKISLDLILEQESGKLANDILMIFGYIRPDYVESTFLMKILTTDETSLLKAINLLEKYNLVSKAKKLNVEDDVQMFSKKRAKVEVEMHLLSIHRLLQQVIRHNGRETEEQTLRKILGCEGFIDCKLLPFTKYADAKLQKEFPKVRAELLDQEQLKKLIEGERFEESVQLAKFISEELKTNTSRFNYAICLDKNGQLEESVDVLEKLEKKEMEEDYDGYHVIMGILKLENEASKHLIYGHLLVLQWRLGNRNRIKEFLEKGKQYQIIYSNKSLDILIQIVNSDLIQSNYSLVKDECNSTITFKLGTESKKIKLDRYSLDLASFYRLSPTELILKWVSFTRGGQKLEEVITVNEFINLDKINRLTLSISNDTKMCIDLCGDVSLEYLYLINVPVLDWRESKSNIQRLILENIPFEEKTKMTIKEMKILKSSVLDISCLPRTIQKLEINITEVVCRGEIDLPNLNYLTIELIDHSSFLSYFHSVNLTHIHFWWINKVNLDLLPKSVTHVKISGRETIVDGGVREVVKLILEGFSFPKVEELLSQFLTDDLVVYYFYGITPTELIALTQKGIKKIAVGNVECGWPILSNYVDRKADFYLWEGGRGRGIERKKLEELKRLY